MPGPSSLTAMESQSSSPMTVTCTWLPCGEYLTALPIRLLSTCSRRVASARRLVDPVHESSSWW